MKNKIILFLIVFSLGIITIYPSFVNTHSLDSYCTIHYGYKYAVESFLQKGQPISTLSFIIFDYIKLPFDSLSFVSAFLTALFLSFSVIKIYSIINNNLNLKGNLNKIILLISSFLLFFNPLLTEVLVLDDGFVIAIGIFLVMSAVSKINTNKLSNYIIAFILIVLAGLCHKGALCYLFPVMLLTIISNKTSILKKSLIPFIAYIIALLSSFIFIKTINSSFNDINIIDNIKNIFTVLLPKALLNLYGFMNTQIYYLIIAVVFSLIIYLIIKSTNKKQNILYLVLLLAFTIIVPFIPNLLDTSSEARMVLVLGAVPSILMLYILIVLKLSDKLKCISFVVMLIMFIMSFMLIHQNTMINFNRYKEDAKYIKLINERIKWYENKSDYKVKTIYFAKDTDVSHYYDIGNANGANIRILDVQWALECAFPIYSENKYTYKKMSKKDYNRYFKGKNYDKFDDKQLVFDKDKLYLLLY